MLPKPFFLLEHKIPFKRRAGSIKNEPFLGSASKRSSVIIIRPSTHASQIDANPS
jgi:hypothetical protein